MNKRIILLFFAIIFSCRINNENKTKTVIEDFSNEDIKILVLHDLSENSVSIKRKENDLDLEVIIDSIVVDKNNRLSLNYSLEYINKDYFLLDVITDDYSILFDSKTLSAHKLFYNYFFIEKERGVIFFKDLENENNPLRAYSITTEKITNIELRNINDTIYAHSYKGIDDIKIVKDSLHLSWHDKERQKRDSLILIDVFL